MRFRWIALGVVGFAVWLIATFAVVYAAVDLAEDGTQAIVTGHSSQLLPGTGIGRTTFCVSYIVIGVTGQVCETSSTGSPETPFSCYLDAEIGKQLPDSCQ